MNAVLITSSSDWSAAEAGLGTYCQVPAPASALSASTSVATAASRGWPKSAEFSISSSEMTSAPSPLIAATILACWRARSSSSAAPRGPSSPFGPVQVLTVTLSPARSL